MSEQSQNEEAPNKWAQQFETAMTRAFDSLAQKLGSRVIVQPDVIFKEPTTPEEARLFEQAVGKDFYRVDEKGNVVEPTIKYRLLNVFPQFGADASVSNGFIAKGNVERWQEKPEAVVERFSGLKVIEGEQRTILGHGFVDCRIFFRTHRPTTVSILDQEGSDSCQSDTHRQLA